jgi:hypothetical protein
MKRSGHHAIMEWIKAHTKQDIKNNVVFGWESKKLLTMKGKQEAIDGITNIEDFNPDDWSKFDFPSFPFVIGTIKLLHPPIPVPAKIVLVMRSANNWLASCYKRKFQDNEEHKDVYKYLNKPYINDGKRKSSSRIDLYAKQLMFSKDPDIVNVSFDNWFKSKDYRRLIANNLGFEWNKDADASRKRVANYGKGSSFDGVKYDLKAQDMKVLERGEEFRGDPEFELYRSELYRKVMKVSKEMRIKKCLAL